MTETATPLPSARAPRPKAAGLALLAGVLALGASGYALWSAAQAQRRLQPLETTVRVVEQARGADAARIAQELDALKRDAQALARKTSDADAASKSVREEVLGLGERAGLIEDALRSLAERRLQGQVALKVNEAEFLLRAGVERLKLFHDAAATAQAFRLADAELAEIDDAMFTGVRQTIAAELAILEQAPVRDRAAAMARCEELAELARKLPTRMQARDEAPKPAPGGWLDRAEATLAQFIRVRRMDATEAALVNPLFADTAREALALRLLLAKSALAQGEDQRYRAELERAAQRAASAFAETDPSAREFRDGLKSLLDAPPAPPLPEVGRALDELRNLRATRALADELRPKAKDKDKP